MHRDNPPLAHEVETVAYLRELYRASEARAARLRLLSLSGRAMAEAGNDGINEVLDHVAAQLAYFVGHSRAVLSLGPDGEGIAIPAPGDDGRIVGRIAIEGLCLLDQIADSEDRDTFHMQLEMMGTTIDRINRERERSELLIALQEREQRLENLVGRIFFAQEDERRRVSHDLHDGVAQTATALARMLEGGSSMTNTDIPAAERTNLAAIARDLVAELRAVIGGLRPTLLDDLGLEAAIQSLGDTLAGDGFDVDTQIEHIGINWPANTETALFRVAQEAVTNIRKHAGRGCRVEIELVSSASDGGFLLRIEDFGKGCQIQPVGAATASGGQIGIDVMRERMAAIGGRLVWEAKPDNGVTVIAQCGGNL
jgi:two-component system NarL family sensor kinase